MNWSPSQITFGLAFAIVIITAAAPGSRAQICPGSNLFYLVRDAKGAVISADQKDLKFQGEATKSPGVDWSAQAIDDQHLRSKTVPSEVSRLNGKVALRKMTFCNFQTDVKLSIMLGGQTMNLLFHTPKLPETVSTDFVVDAVPFRTGDYEITLQVLPNTWVNYYPASLWKKATGS